ncbi:OB-fold nucleic acid binding domain-containing protein [Desulfococcaceae bacterium HSG7]|nr:OB-fold nucleic acid binding domain-containing protein [Desulfococcaceae bacterium HSG7]
MGWNTVLRKPVRATFLGYRQGYDLEVDHPEHNYVLASGLCCSNSHSAAYALIAFQTAFLKAHFPVEFMAALLSSELNSIDGIVKYIADCRAQGISIQPPDIMESDQAFTVIKDEIRFGLAAVKNVGEGAIESIIKARQEKPFASLFDFCERVDLKKVNKRVVESLIKCGAFDSTGEYRSRMTAALEGALDYGQRIQKEKDAPQIGLFDMSGGPAINAPTMPETDEWDESERLALEKEMLGFYITGHPLDGYEALLEKYTNADTVSLKEKADGEAVRIGGIIRTIKTIKTKKGEQMAFVTIEDMLGALELVVFPSVYAKVAQLLTDDNPVLVEGAVQKDENSATILCDTMIPIDKAEETWTASICFNLDLNRLTKEDFPKLKALLKKHAGTCQAYLHLRDPEKSETVMALPEEIKVKPGMALTREVNALIGYHAVETLCSPAKVTSGNGKYKNYRKGNSSNA